MTSEHEDEPEHEQVAAVDLAITCGMISSTMPRGCGALTEADVERALVG